MLVDRGDDLHLFERSAYDIPSVIAMTITDTRVNF
jgi:hypothetical protein